MTLALTVGPAIDYLYGLAQQSVTGVTVMGIPAVACDGPVIDLDPAMFVIGLEAPMPEPSRAVTGTDLAPILGDTSLQESYDIPCHIDVRESGATQKAVRDVAHGMFNTFLNLLMADRSLNGVLKGGGALIVDVSAAPFLVGTAGEPGQRHLLAFTVRCTDLQLG